MIALAEETEALASSLATQHSISRDVVRGIAFGIAAERRIRGSSDDDTTLYLARFLERDVEEIVLPDDVLDERG